VRGNDCTIEQLRAAEKFLGDFAAAAKRLPAGNCLIQREDLIRLLAWYGALRYRAAEEGIGTCEFPGELLLLTPREAAAR
jgi:hypothetical protein